VRPFSSLLGRKVETESGRSLGSCHDLRAQLEDGNPTVSAIVVGRRGLLEHFGIGSAKAHRPDAVRWDAVVRIEGKRIVVKDGTELE